MALKMRKAILQDSSYYQKSRSVLQPTGHDATSIIFSINHLPGALFNILDEFAKRNINLTRIESRPTEGNALGIQFLCGY